MEFVTQTKALNTYFARKNEANVQDFTHNNA